MAANSSTKPRTWSPMTVVAIPPTRRHSGGSSESCIFRIRPEPVAVSRAAAWVGAEPGTGETVRLMRMSCKSESVAMDGPGPDSDFCSLPRIVRIGSGGGALGGGGYVGSGGRLGSGGGALGAPAAQGEVVGVDDKPGFGFEPYPQRVEGAVGDLDDLVAHFTDQVVVDIIGQMPAGGAVADVDVKGDIEPFEQLEGAIDGGQVDIGVLGPYRVGQLLSGEVVIAAVEGFDHRPSVNGDPSTREPNRLDCLLDPFCRHLGERSGRGGRRPGWARRKGAIEGRSMDWKLATDNMD